MKRLKMPKIPTRVPVPDMPSIRIRSSKKDKGEFVADAVPLVAEEQAPETQPVEQIAVEQPAVEQPVEVKESGHRKVNMPNIPLPSISKPTLRKPSAPKIPLPSISKPGAPKLSVPKIPLPGISMPGKSRKAHPQEEEQPQPEMIEKAAPEPYSPEPAATADSVPEQAEEKARPKISIHKISAPKMPSLRKAKEKQPADETTTERETPPAAEDEKKPKARITGIHIPSFRKAKEKPETAAETEPAPQLQEPPAPIKEPYIPMGTPSIPVDVQPSSIEEPPAPIKEPYIPMGTPSIPVDVQPSSVEEPPAPWAPIAPPEVPPTPVQVPSAQAQFTPAGVSESSIEAPPSPPETPKAKGKSKLSMPKMPKIGMPSMSVGKGKGGGTRSTGKRILALSIEGNDIRMLSYANNAVDSWKSVPFDASLLKMGQVADPVGLGEIIKSAVVDIEVHRCYVLCALPGLRSVSRIISIPNVSKKEMETIIPREVRRTMTVSEEDNYFHWQVLPVEAAQARVFVLAVPKEPISLLLRSLSNAGLNPSQMDLKPLALMRAINQKDAIIANCEGNSMELVIVSDDIPVLIRSVFLGEGVANQDYAVGRISDELGRTVVTYNEINKERPLDQDVPVYLTGAAASGVPFALNVAALTGRTVQPLESPVTVPEDLPLAEYMVNIGLLLKVV
ncbi:MAG: hypothetical protein WC562_00615 [Dehalococcoidia bacterium]